MTSAAVGVALDALARRDPWKGAKAPAIPFYGRRAERGGFDLAPVAAGAAAHTAISIGWSLPFALALPTRRVAVAAGALWGLVVWAGMFRVVLPAFGLAHVARSLSPARALAEHVLFGAAVGLATRTSIPRRSR